MRRDYEIQFSICLFSRGSRSFRMDILTLITVTFLAICAIGANSHDFGVEREGSWMHPQVNHAAQLMMEGKAVEDGEYWWSEGQMELKSQMAARQIKIIENVAKNVVMFLGDGMSVPTITAARILKGQQVDKVTFGEEGSLHMDTFPHVAVSKTFCADIQVADSACSATAYLCGVKNNVDMLGVKPSLLKDDCAGQADPVHHISSILAWAQAAGKSTGIVTTTRVTHATPAGAYAHSANRDWESDRDVRLGGGNASLCHDIAYQLVMEEPGRNINVILGGGRREFMRNNETDPETNTAGEREDNLNLIDEWQRSKEGSVTSYVTSRDELLGVNTAETEFLLGLFGPSDVGYFDQLGTSGDPTLEEMTQVAIQILEKNSNGFFLLVEGGRIDHAHHDNTPQRALWETIEFDKAIKRGDEMTQDDETLVIVTADHSHVMSIAGYPVRGNPIQKVAQLGRDDLPYNTLGYANGPGYREYVNGFRPDVTNDDFDSVTYRPPVGVPMNSETHGGDDVLIFSKGPYAHFLSGVQQQSYIAHVMGFASCVGDGVHAPECLQEETDSPPPTTPSGGEALNARMPGFYFLILFSLITLLTFLAN